MSNKREHPDRLNRWLGVGNRNVSSLSDSSERGSATSGMSASSTTREMLTSPFSVSSSKTNSVAVVTAEESSANRPRKLESSETSSDLSGSKRDSDFKDNGSPSPLIHVHKRRKKVNIDSSSSEEKNESAEGSSASSDTSEKDDSSSSSSSLLYKRGTANSNVKTFVSLRKKQNENNSSSDTSDQDGPPTSLSRAQHHREEIDERYQNDGTSSSSSHDATISKLSSSSYSQSINSSSDTKAEAYASSCSSPPSDTSDQDNARRTKDIAEGRVDPYENSKHDDSAKNIANRSEKAISGTMKTFADSSPSISASSDTSDPESSGSASTSSSVKRKRIIVGNAMQAYQTTSSSSTAAFDACSTSSTSTTSTTKRKKVIIGNALQTYQSSLSSTANDTSEESKAEKEDIEFDDTGGANKGSFLSTPSLTSFLSSSVPSHNKNSYEARPSPMIGVNEDKSVVSNDSIVSQASLPSSISNRSMNSDSLTSKINSCMYQDYSHITVEIAEASSEWKEPPRGLLNKDPPFPQKLHQILANPDVQEWILWLPHGRAWKILNQKKFEENVLPKYFQHNKLPSFMRQVNTWGFKRILSGPDEKAYYHELFLRGLPHLCVKMYRQPRGKLQERMKSVYAQIQLTPDFYQMSREHPLPEVLQTPSINQERSQSSDRSLNYERFY